MLGTEIEVPTLNGKASLKIPECTQPETIFRLKGKGIPHLQGFGSGDQYVRIKIKMPPKLNHKEKSMIQELATMRGENTLSSDSMEFIRRR